MYYARRQLSIKYPNQYLSIIVDAASSFLTALPAFWRVSKALPTRFKPYACSLLGVLVHGKEGFFGYTIDGACPKGANSTVEAIHRTLGKLAEDPDRQEHWPEVFYVQVSYSLC